MPPIQLIRAGSPLHYTAARRLFREYAESLGFSLCFQSFDYELENLESIYSPPGGGLILALSGKIDFVGCVGVKRFDEAFCEMKRLYVRPPERDLGLGTRLVEESISLAKELNYHSMRLDTIRVRMQSAISLYSRAGFKEIPPYYDNPMEGVLYMERILDA